MAPSGPRTSLVSPAVSASPFFSLDQSNVGPGSIRISFRLSRIAKLMLSYRLAALRRSCLCSVGHDRISRDVCLGINNGRWVPASPVLFSFLFRPLFESDSISSQRSFNPARNAHLSRKGVRNNVFSIAWHQTELSRDGDVTRDSVLAARTTQWTRSRT